MRVPLTLPPGVSSNDTAYAASGRWADINNMRFWQGLPQAVGGWEMAVGTALTGICRSILPWTDGNSIINAAFGTNSKLEVFVGGGLYDITPTLLYPAVILGANPVATTNLSSTVVITQTGHPYTTGDSITISGATAVATVTINGTWTISAATANTWSFVAGSNANATASGGGSAVKITPNNAWVAGAVNGTGGQGYGAGAYSTGTYSSPSTADYFPLTWSLAAWGENLMACPRGGTIYGWTNATGTPAAPLLNAPDEVTFMLVAPQDQVFALGCNEEVSTDFNPLCLRHSSIRNNTEWNTASSTTAREYILPGGGRIVGGRVIANYLLVWTNHSLFLGTYVGSLQQPWRFDKVGDKCGLLAPNAAVVVGQRAFWLGSDYQFYSYTLGGAVIPVECPILNEFVDNITTSQFDKITASSVSKFNEIRFDYPDSRDGTENSRYISLIIQGSDAGAWSRGIMDRTAFVDAGPTDFPLGVDASGYIYWHERGQSADGGAFSWFIETADTYLDESRVTFCRQLWPDIKDQIGPVYVEFTTSQFPQDADARSYGPYTMSPNDKKLDIRVSGRLIRTKFSGSSAPTSCRLGRFVFDLTPAGQR